jgi:hypothetical protein
MISPLQKAGELIFRYNRLKDAVAQAKQCEVLAHDVRKPYWEQVIYYLEKLHADNGAR